jgi:hypothetical protein
MRNWAIERLRALAGGLPLYATVDLASAPRALRDLGIASATVGCLFEHAMVEDAESVSPWLIALSSSGTPHLLSRTVDIAARAPAVTWIASDLAPLDLLQRLQRRVDVLLTHGESLLLRYYDPRLLPELVGCLKNEQRQQFLAVGQRWMVLDREFHCHSFDGPPSMENDPLIELLQLDNDQEAFLVEVSEANRALVLVEEVAPGALEAVPPRQRYALARRCGEELAAVGLGALPERMALMPLAAAGGNADAFFRSAPWMSTRANLANRSISFDDALAELSR